MARNPTGPALRSSYCGQSLIPLADPQGISGCGDTVPCASALHPDGVHPVGWRIPRCWAKDFSEPVKATPTTCKGVGRMAAPRKVDASTPRSETPPAGSRPANRAGET